jgi:tetratricopeptide (TPR) repeat protein
LPETVPATNMRFSPSRVFGFPAASALVLTFFITSATAADSDVTNLDLCNGRTDASPDQQIEGCTALLKSADEQRVIAVIYSNRGNGYVGKGQYDLALQDYDEAIKADPQYAKAYNNRGVVYQKQAEYDLAIKDFNAALQLDPDYAHALANRGETYLKMSDYQSASKDFDQALRLKPQLALLLNERCWTRAIVGDVQGALADCNDAIRSEPSAAAFDSRGLAYLKSSQWDAAIADYNSALRLDPKLASSLYGRGFAKQKKGDVAGGTSDLAAAQTINQNVAQDFARYGLH